jgi:molybdopterin-containing oxidoreductase family iron-sulfur binding subunit
MAELLALFAGGPVGDGHALVRAHWLPVLGGERGWEEALASGVIAGTAPSPRNATARSPGAIAAALLPLVQARLPGVLEVDLAPSPAIHDGRFAGNAWLEELPHPITKLTWGNAAMMSSRQASRLGVGSGDVVAIAAGGRQIEVAALVVPGHADSSITVELGYRPEPGAASASGYALAAAAGQRTVEPVAVHATGQRVDLARTQGHMTPAGREIAPSADLAAYRARPDFTSHQRGRLPTLLGDPPRRGPQWAMTIDTGICTGCSACVVACQAENNVPAVGRDGVLGGREMHWLRIDTYFTGPAPADLVHQPMLCQHCEHAPCEYVCPVYATTHSPDGLNEMTYNRCVGTRFCSNNCPYKVRRFNWFEYTARATTESLQRNPDVTVRQRGVMEKCTYCVQRIRGAEIQARIEDRQIRPGEVVTACQQVCPTGAIQFGALEHSDSEMVRRRGEPRRYAVLHDLGTRPRTIYLAKIRNPAGSVDG